MAQAGNPVSMGAHPFATLLRSSDRDRFIVQLVAAVWDSILGLPILLREDLPDLDAEPGRTPLLAGHVRISGAWAGIVVMCVPLALARECAALMYGRAGGGPTDREVADAWGELVNMVGGNLKGLLPPPVKLSLPEVQGSATWSVREPGTTVLNELTFACLGKRLRVTILKGAS